MSTPEELKSTVESAHADLAAIRTKAYKAKLDLDRQCARDCEEHEKILEDLQVKYREQAIALATAANACPQGPSVDILNQTVFRRDPQVCF